MGLKIVNGAIAGARFISDVRVCLDERGETTVPCDSSAAHTLLVGAGGSIDVNVARQYGLVREEEDAPKTAPENKASKEARPSSRKPKTAPENKAVQPSEDK